MFYYGFHEIKLDKDIQTSFSLSFLICTLVELDYIHQPVLADRKDSAVVAVVDAEDKQAVVDTLAAGVADKQALLLVDTRLLAASRPEGSSKRL